MENEHAAPSVKKPEFNAPRIFKTLKRPGKTSVSFVHVHDRLDVFMVQNMNDYRANFVEIINLQVIGGSQSSVRDVIVSGHVSRRTVFDVSKIFTDG